MKLNIWPPFCQSKSGRKRLLHLHDAVIRILNQSMENGRRFINSNAAAFQQPQKVSSSIYSSHLPCKTPLNPKLLSVFCHSAPGNGNLFFFEDIHDLLVAVWFLFILAADQFTDHLFHLHGAHGFLSAQEATETLKRSFIAMVPRGNWIYLPLMARLTVEV